MKSVINKPLINSSPRQIPSRAQEQMFGLLLFFPLSLRERVGVRGKIIVKYPLILSFSLREKEPDCRGDVHSFPPYSAQEIDSGSPLCCTHNDGIFRVQL
jgi:hypothetical protein